MASYDAEIRVKTSLENQTFKVEAKKLENSLAEIEKKAIGAREKLDALDKAGAPKTSQQYKNAQEELLRWSKALNNFMQQREEAMHRMERGWNPSKGNIDDDVNYKNLFASWQEASEKANVFQSQIGVYFADGSDKVQMSVAEIEKAIDAAKEKMEDLKQIPQASPELYQSAEKDLAKWTAEIDAVKGKQQETASDFSEHINLMKMDIEQYADNLKQLEKEGKYFGDADYDKMYRYWKDAVDGAKKYQAELNKHTEKGQAEEAARAAKELEKKEAIQRRIEAQEEKRIQKENLQIQKEAEKQAKLQAQTAEEQRLAGIKANATVADQKIVSLLERRKQLQVEIAELEKAGVTAGYQEYDSRQAELKNINTQFETYKNNVSEIPKQFNKVKESAKKAFNTVSGGAKKSSGFLSTFTSRLKGIALSLLIFNWISKGFNAMVAGMKKGFENLMKYSGDYANSVQSLKNAQVTLGNSFAAAFAPIVQTVIPWLVQLINTISRAMTYVAQFVAILDGKSTFTRAKQVQDAYNKSLGGTAGAAKKAAGALAKFDDLDVLQKQDDSGGGGGENAADMFEEVPVDPKVKGWLDGIRDGLKPILDYMKELKGAFMEGFWDGLGDPSGRFEIIKKGLAQIKEALLDIWNDPAVRGAADSWAESLLYMFGSLVGSIASIGLTIAAAFIGGLGEYLENNTGRIKEFLVSAFNIGTEINNLLADLFQSIAYIFEGFASESGIRFVSALIGVFADAGMGLLEVALKLGRDILNMLIQPIVENQEGFRTALEGLLSGAATILEGLKTSIDSIFDNLNAVYDEHFKPFFDSIASGLSSIVGTLLSVWNGSIQPVIDRISQKISELLTQYITPFVNNVVEFIGQIATHLQHFWEMFLQPLIEWFITYVVPILSEAISLIIEIIIQVVESIMTDLNGLMDFINDTVMPAWNGFWESAGDTFDAFWQVISTIGDLIKNMFLGVFDVIRKLIDKDWKGAWDSAKKIFTTFKDNVKSIIDSIREFFQKFIDWIGEKIEWVLNKVQGIKDFFGGGGGGSPTGDGGYARTARSFMAASPTSISAAMADIPHLASGAVLRGGNPFLAVLGDQRAGQTNIEAPLSTIEQAVENVMNRRGNGVGSFSPVIPLNVNGQEFARLILHDILGEMQRQGYDVEVLGV